MGTQAADSVTKSMKLLLLQKILNTGRYPHVWRRPQSRSEQRQVGRGLESFCRLMYILDFPDV